MRLLRERKRFNAVACGRRFGKTLFAALELVANASLDGVPCGWFAPNYKYLDEPWRNFLRVMKPVVKSSDKQSRRIELITGATVDFWTLEDEDAGRSRAYGLVIVDEAGLVKDLERKWFDAIRPTLSDLKGEGWLLGTPKGRNFFWTAYTNGQDPLNDEWMSWQMPTVTNPFIDPQEVDAAKAGMPERSFMQEYLAEFLDEAGGVFRGVRDVVKAGRKTLAPTGAVSVGIDIARIEDFTVLTAVDDTGKELEVLRFNQISWERIYAEIKSFLARYPKCSVWLDATGAGDPVYDRVKKDNPGHIINGYVFTNTSKEALIDNLAIRIEQKEIELLDIPEQTNELLAYQYELTPSRNVRMNAPEGMHDDTVIALALAVWGIAKKRTIGFS